MADEEEIAATDEEKLKIAQHFLLASPPGQFSDVLSDLSKLLPSGLLSEEAVAETIKNYHSSNGKIATDGNNKVLVHKHGEVDATHFIDTSSRRVVGVDHVAGVVLGGDVRDVGSELDESVEADRAELAKGLADYVASQYVTESATSGVYSSSGTLYAVIYGERLNLRNYWSGSWLSVWKIDNSASGTPTLSGSVKIHAHYFEEGNVQLQTSKAMPDTPLTDADWKSSAVAAIKAFEHDLHSGLGNMYTNMGDETFKAMRRKMLLSRQKFEWNINAHRVAKTLGGGGK